jgi:hypothetical protein
MAKNKTTRDKQWYRKYYIDNKKLSNTILFKIMGELMIICSVRARSTGILHSNTYLYKCNCICTFFHFRSSNKTYSFCRFPDNSETKNRKSLSKYLMNTIDFNKHDINIFTNDTWRNYEGVIVS